MSCPAPAERAWLMDVLRWAGGRETYPSFVYVLATPLSPRF